MIKYILFDVSKTLLTRKTDYTGTDLIIEHFGLKQERKIVSKTFEQVVQTRVWQSPEEAFSALCVALGIDPNEENVKKMIELRHDPDKDFELMPQTEKILSELKKRPVGLAILPNATQFQYDWFNKRHPDFFKQFDKVFWSYEIGLIKPDPEAYKYVIQALGVKPAEILMVGDNPENDVELPKSLGMQALLFEESKDMLKEIEKVLEIS